MKRAILSFLFFGLITCFPQEKVSSSLFVPTETSSAVAEKAKEATVFIACETNYFDLAYGPEPYYLTEYFLRGWYEWLWPQEYGHGSGFLISDDGYIVTNEHVIRNSTDLLVVIQDPEYRLCKARVIGHDNRTDIAVIKIEPLSNKKFPYLQLGDSSQIKVGEPVMVIGNPIHESLEASVTMGIVSAKDREPARSHQIGGHIQTDASINGGNSGGPLINMKGEVIGMNTWTYTHYLGYEGVGFAVPSNSIKLISKQLIAHGKVSQGFFGVEFNEAQLTAFGAYYFRHNKGAILEDVLKDSPAKKAGLLPGDCIIKLDGMEITSPHSLKDQIRLRAPGTTITVTVDRKGKIYEFTLQLGSEEQSKRYRGYWGSNYTI